MFNLKQAIQSWKRSLKKSPVFEEVQIKEMETHLRDEIEELIGKVFLKKKLFKRPFPNLDLSKSSLMRCIKRR